MMRRFSVPSNVSFFDLGGKKLQQEALSFSEFVCRSLLNDPRCGQSLHNLRASIRIEKACAAAEEGSSIVLDERDWELLKTVAETPTGGAYVHPNGNAYSTFAVRQLVPFLDAIAGAAEAPTA